MFLFAYFAAYMETYTIEKVRNDSLLFKGVFIVSLLLVRGQAANVHVWITVLRDLLFRFISAVFQNR